MDQREAEKTYGLTGEALTDVPWSFIDLRNAWNRARGDVAPWWSECSKEAFAAGLANLAAALRSHDDSKNGKRKGRRMGFPKFRKRSTARVSYRHTAGTYGPDGDLYVKLPRVGRVKVHEPMGTLTARLADGRAKLGGATVSRLAGRWCVSFTVTNDRVIPEGPSPEQCAAGTVVVDLGVRTLAVLSTGEQIPNPKPYAAARRKLRRPSRALSRCEEGSRGEVKRKAAVPRLHHRVANQRRDGIHKLTTRLAREHETIVVEDLDVAGMVRNRKLAKAISDAGFGEIRRQLAYKTGWYGATLHVANRWYPSSKTCSACGWRNPRLTLRQRTFHCQSCGLVIDRDHNAAVNLRDLVAASTSETQNARGADRRTAPARRVAVKREPGTATAGQTRGASPTGEAA